ncbi:MULTISPECIES: hypothetical protein [unclassified Methylobacterium]|jgi:hypothetical protein|uniref:hypothetical protein n=1 Tax=unclassified Methylobacterium TaxID=2615210 RepID=UPI001354D7D4|nr:hypothetical protein [Methylobacterium sp. 2A]MWV25275.1 hypothetical protein [Methylobacterium sp. 2A]
MTDEPILPVNVTISAEAWDEIGCIRHIWDSQFEDKADVPVISWGRTILNDGRSWSHVVVSFFSVSERQRIAYGIQMLSGREVVFNTVPEFYNLFAGKVLRFAPSKLFFLAPN